MASETGKSLAKRASETALMPPPPPPKRQKRPAKVLDEDVYSAALSKIIARDFFPGLLESNAQGEYLDALESQNSEWIREAGRNLTRIMTPKPGDRRRIRRGTSFIPARSSTIALTPRTAAGDGDQTPNLRDDFAPEDQAQGDIVDTDMSLAAFQSKYTSEDNESFNALLDKQNLERSDRYAFFHNGNQIPSARQIAYRARESRLLESSNIASTSLVRNGTVGGDVVLSAPQPSADLDARVASVESFKNHQGPRNSFMFDPDGVEDSMTTPAQIAEQTSNAPPKAVSYTQTRFAPAINESLVAPSPSLSAIDAAIAGRPRPLTSEPDYSGTETPRVNGYAFVDAEPTPEELGVPVTDEEADQAEKEVLARLLPKADTSRSNPFNIASRSRREDIHMRLVEKADAARRKGGSVDKLRALRVTPAGTPTPGLTPSNSKKGMAMTPAAQRLAQRIATPRRESGLFDRRKEGGSSWTPTPRTKKIA